MGHNQRARGPQPEGQWATTKGSMGHSQKASGPVGHSQRVRGPQLEGPWATTKMLYDTIKT